VVPRGKLERSDSHPLEVPLHDIRWVTSSNGDRQRRPIIRTSVSLKGHIWEVDLSLTPRTSMEFPMLLGREAIRRRFVVDPARSFLAKEFLPSRRARG
jgi:ribosomal protein S6--L-glutamate ligase